MTNTKVPNVESRLEEDNQTTPLQVEGGGCLSPPFLGWGPQGSHKSFSRATLSCYSPVNTHSSSGPRTWVPRVLPLLALQRREQPEPSLRPLREQRNPEISLRRVFARLGLPSLAILLSRRPGPARVPFLTLSSSPPSEAVVTTAINAVVVADLSSQCPQLGPLNPTSRPPHLRQGAERVTKAARVESGPASLERAGRSPVVGLVLPLLHTCNQGTRLPPAAAASQTRRRVVTFHPAPSARRRVGRLPRSLTVSLCIPFPLHFKTSIFLLGCALWRHLPPPIPYDTTCGACPGGLGGKIRIFPPLLLLSHSSEISLPWPCFSRLVVLLMTFKRSFIVMRFYKVGSSS